MTNGIYLYYDKLKNYVVYVGKDSYINKKKRHIEHNQKRRYHDQPINRIVQNNPNRYEYRVYCEGNYSNDELNNLEIKTIKLFDTFDRKDAFNFTKGGDGCFGRKQTDYQKSVASEYMKQNNPNYGGLSKEHKNKISKALIGNTHKQDKCIHIHRRYVNKTNNKPTYYISLYINKKHINRSSINKNKIINICKEYIKNKDTHYEYYKFDDIVKK